MLRRMALLAVAAASVLVAVPGAGSRPAAAPSGFVAAIDYLDANHAWAVLYSQCGARTCHRVAATDDAGRTWHLLARLPFVCHGDACTYDLAIRRFTAREAVVTGPPGTFLTTDGGAHWRSLAAYSEGSARVGGELFVLASPHSGCPAACAVTLQRVSPGGRSISEVPGFVSPSLGYGDALVEAGGTLIAVGYGHIAGGARGAQARLSVSRDAGRHWSSRPDPCNLAHGPEVDAFQVTTSGPVVAFLCFQRPGGPTSMVVSRDAGATFVRHRMPLDAATVAVDAAGDIALASGPPAYHVALSRDGGRTWSLVLNRHAPGAMTPPFGLAVFGGDVRVITGQTLWRSDDAGHTWFSSPAP